MKSATLMMSWYKLLNACGPLPCELPTDALIAILSTSCQYIYGFCHPCEMLAVVCETQVQCIDTQSTKFDVHSSPCPLSIFLPLLCYSHGHFSLPPILACHTLSFSMDIGLLALSHPLHIATYPSFNLLCLVAPSQLALSCRNFRQMPPNVYNSLLLKS